MKMVRLINTFLLFGTLLLFLPGSAQLTKRTAVTSYTIEEGLLQNSVASLVTDKFGFVWFSTGAGLQRFDGRHFEMVESRKSNGGFLTAARLTVLRNEEIWLSDAEGIRAIDPHTAKTRTIYSKPRSNDYAYIFAGENEQSVWYFSEEAGLLQFGKQAGRLLSKIPFPTYLHSANHRYFCKPVNDSLLVVHAYKTLAVFNTRQQRFVFSHTTGSLVLGFLPLDKNRILFAKEGAYFQVDVQTGKERFLAVAEGAHKNSAFELLLTKTGTLLSAFDQKNIYELDTATFSVKTRWVGFNRENILHSGYITHAYLDRFDRLWLLTNSDGVKKLSFSQQRFDYFGTANRENNFVRSIYADKKAGLVLAGTYGSGLLLFDTVGNLVHRLPLTAGQNSVMNIAHLQGPEYLLHMLGNHGFYRFNTKTLKAQKVTIKAADTTRFHSSYYSMIHTLPEGYFLLSDQRLVRFRVKGNTIVDTTFFRPYNSPIYNFIQLANSNYCIATEKGLEFTDTAFRRLRFASFTQPIFPRCLTEDKKRQLWIGTETGLYKLDKEGNVLKKYTLADGLTDEGIYAIQPTPGGIYFSHNKGLSFLSDEERFTHYSRHAGLQENEFNTKASLQTADGQVFFGGINGITAFYPSSLARQASLPPVSITALLVGDKPWKDTAVWNMQQLSLQPDENRLALRVGVPAATDNEGYVYEYKMEGLEPTWITTSGTDFIRYALSPGQYTFRVRLSNSQQAGTNETTLHVLVAAPFWQRGWFRAGAAVLLIGLLAFSIHRYNRRRYLQKIKQLEMEHRLQLERERISRDLHDNLGAYASAIAYNVDRVVKGGADDARLQSLKEAAAEIMTNLRDTIWALNKKQISVLTLTDRIKAYLQKMRDAYPAIQFSLEENVDTAAVLSPEFALNVLRIVQEAFHNAIKHSGGNKILLTLQVDKQLHVCIRDNGKGLPQTVPNGGHGLHNMHLRAKEAGLQLTIDSSAEKGTTVELFSPVQ